jgi:hypothetical protein
VSERGSQGAALPFPLRPHQHIPVSVADGSSPSAPFSSSTTQPEQQSSSAGRAPLVNVLGAVALRPLLPLQRGGATVPPLTSAQPRVVV